MYDRPLAISAKRYQIVKGHFGSIEPKLAEFSRLYLEANEAVQDSDRAIVAAGQDQPKVAEATLRKEAAMEGRLTHEQMHLLYIQMYRFLAQCPVITFNGTRYIF